MNNNYESHSGNNRTNNDRNNGENNNQNDRGNKKALVVAVSDYDSSSGLKSLDFCKNDGQEMYNILKKNEYEIPDNYKLIGRVTSSKLKEIIYDFFTAESNKPDDTLVFYYSGHGVPDRLGTMYLAPSDMDIQHPLKTGFSFDDLTDLMLACNSMRVVTILDNFFSGSLTLGKGAGIYGGPLGKVLRTYSGPLVGIGLGIYGGRREETVARIANSLVEEKADKLNQGVGRCLLASSQGYEEAYNRQEKDHSIFTYYLLEGLKGHKNAVDDKGNVTYDTLRKFVDREIGNLPSDKRPKQTLVSKGDISGEIIIAQYPNLKKLENNLQNFVDIKAISDVPTVNDSLTFNGYSQRLANIIKNSTPRFAIGIFGGWGTGKTSLMKMIQKNLSECDDSLVVWFDAWKYEREKHLAVVPLLRTIELELENKISVLENDKRNSERNVHFSKLHEAWSFIREPLKKTYRALESIEFNVGSGLPASGKLNLESMIDRFKADGYVMIDGERRYYYHHISEHLVEGFEKLKKHIPSAKIIIFIDDLDRCIPEKALEVLESIKTFFDMDGFVYVIGMDPKSIDYIVQNKYGQSSGIKGFNYMQKLIQLPFIIPMFRELDQNLISNYMHAVISEGFGGTEFVKEFDDAKINLIRKLVQNPREVKQFINNIILARSVIAKPFKELIVVQALSFRSDWNWFYELISPNKRRETFLKEYKELKEQIDKDKMTFANKEEIDNFIKDKFQEHSLSNKETLIQLFISRDNDSLRSFLDEGAGEILYGIKYMEHYRTTVDTVKLKEVSLEYSATFLTPEERKSRQTENTHVIRMWIDGSDETLSFIKKVSYILHPTFKPSVVTIDSSKENFVYETTAWGQFVLKAKVYYRNGEARDLSTYISFNS